VNIALRDLGVLCVSAVNSSSGITHRRGAENAKIAQRKPSRYGEFCRTYDFEF